MSESSNDTEKEAEVAPKARTPIPPDTILIGSKPVMAYATAVMMHFHGGRNTLTIKARGRAISRAVDVVEVVRRRFFGGKLAVKDVQIGTQALGEGGDVRNVSTIEIKVEKKD
ncbi:MAG: DNA/RNA-binding protein AlbA [Candidatus Bathyarchaeota archaeon]|nr:DNA/RNA-binding protein AlbA [Candidatus Bathyarchaeota archaeon]